MVEQWAEQTAEFSRGSFWRSMLERTRMRPSARWMWSRFATGFCKLSIAWAPV